MTGILIVLGMNVILWEILVKVMFAKTLAGQPCPVRVSGHYDNQEKKITDFSTILEDLNSLVSISFPRELTSLA
jgi:hypothetical protein